jgi:hypothetical protein
VIKTSEKLLHNGSLDRRRFIAALSVCAVCAGADVRSMQLAPDMSRSLTRDERTG